MAVMRPQYSELQLRELEKHSRAEAAFYTACRDQLPKSVLVVHSSGFAECGEDGLHVGEIDFVLAFPEAGLMVVEVKGGGIRRDAGGNWFSTGKNGENKIKNPVNQARDQKYALLRTIQTHQKWSNWKGGKIIIAPAVFLPNVNREGIAKFEGAFANQVDFGGHEDLCDLKGWTTRVNAFWSRARDTNPLGSSGLKLIEEILFPSIELSSGEMRSFGAFKAHSDPPPLQPTAGVAESPTKSWDELIRHLCQDRQSLPFTIEKRNGAIKATREWDPERLAFVWTKESSGDLSFLSDWEEDLLKRVEKAKVKNRVYVVDMLNVSSQSHLSDLPKGRPVRNQSRVRTYDAGPTLDVWQCMHPRVRGHALAHPFVAQRSYLQLVRGILNALEDFHFRGFVHCDLNPGNIALPVRGPVKSMFSADRGQHIEIEPDWDSIRIIDLDFSASRSITPPIRLPHDLRKYPRGASRMSDHLRLRLSAIDDWLAKSGNSSRCYDREFWSRAGNREHLECLQKLDWREDLHQLGYLLSEIRDRWGGAGHVVTMGDLKEVNAFIAAFPDELLKWGSSEQIAWDPARVLNSIEAPNQLPHAGYIARIDGLLRLLSDLPRTITLCRQDHDQEYDPEADSKERTDQSQTRLGPDRNVAAETHLNPSLQIARGEGATEQGNAQQREAIRNWMIGFKPILIGIGALLMMVGWLAVSKTPIFSGFEQQSSQATTAKSSDETFASALANETLAWQKATSDGTRASLNEFLSRYPSSQFVIVAAARVREMDVQELQEREKQRRDFEKSMRDSEIEMAKADDAAWSHAELQNTTASYNAYLRSSFGLRYAGLAKTRLEALNDEQKLKVERTGIDRRRTSSSEPSPRQDFGAPLRHTPQGTKEFFSN